MKDDQPIGTSSRDNESSSELHYTESYFAALEVGSRRSAQIVVPLVLKLVQAKSVIDVGCGTGEWLSIFQQHGVEDIWGVDGAYLDRNLLKIPEERFILADLEQPFYAGRTFDLVVSLEVAEHLPARSAETFVNSLTQLGPAVLFSAAIPNQGGENHVNEQWPEYWAKLFENRGYRVLDPLRRRVWNNRKVQWVYAQNMLMFVAKSQLSNYLLLSNEHEQYGTSALSIVHPNLFMLKMDERKLSNILVRKAKSITKGLLRSLLPHSIYSSLFSTYYAARRRKRMGN
jgi:SAM-dependent methyltransferase